MSIWKSIRFELVVRWARLLGVPVAVHQEYLRREKRSG